MFELEPIKLLVRLTLLRTLWTFLLIKGDKYLMMIIIIIDDLVRPTYRRLICWQKPIKLEGWFADSYI